MRWVFIFVVATAALGGSSYAAEKNVSQTGGSSEILIGGQPVITLSRPSHSDSPHFVSATLLPGCGMNLFQLRAFLPGRGEVNLLSSPSIEEAKEALDDDTNFGNQSFTMGGAILLPFANRVRGTLVTDGKTIETNIAGETVYLPANWKGKKPDAEVQSIHGMMACSKFQDVEHSDGKRESTASASLHAGDFNGHWLSQTDVKVRTTLGSNELELTVTATNVGKEKLPMGIGWHPYFAIPSGNRSQARLLIPARSRALANNSDDSFPTGEIVPVKDNYDFSVGGGSPLGGTFLDDSFTALNRDDKGHTDVELIDPATNYGLRLTGLSPEIRAIQVYAPLDKNFVAIEPQFNLPDPYSSVWGAHKTGMVSLDPGQSVSWRIKLELFAPKR